MRALWMSLGLFVPIAPAASATPARCVMAPADQAWLESALKASDHILEQRLGLPAEDRPTILMFDRRCRFEAGRAASARWVGEPHRGRIHLPNGGSIDSGVTAFASQVDKTGERFFVMALPSVWQAAGKAARGEAGLTGVFVHEFSHTRQLTSLRPIFAAAAATHPMPDNLSDDSLQAHFQSDPAYVATFEKETDLLYRAAAEPDRAKARALARQALALIEARQKRWFVGDEEKWKPYDDLFTTMEGFGQWNAYAWLADPRGGGITAAAAQDKMRGGRKWWSQEQGLAMYLVIDRLLPGWSQRSFAVRPALGIDLLRLAAAMPAGN